jgi:two-component system CheB/CheR fusion protein
MKSALEQNKNTDDTSYQNFPVVGVGASAGGLAAFKAFLSAIPVDSNMAFVLVQHLSATHKSTLTDLLQNSCVIPVLLIKDEVKLAPNMVYVIPPNRMLTSVDGKLCLEPIKNKKIKLIDLFFSSLGVVHQIFAVGVILSGAMDDGTVGLQVIKSSGGITFAQDVDSAEEGSMPQHAIDSGAVDFVLPAEQIVPKLIEINKPFKSADRLGQGSEKMPEDDEDIFKQLLTVLRIRRGVDFSNYKQSTIKRRIVRRMALNKIDKPAAYLHFLREHKTEQDALYNDMLISVTSFFRDSKSFELICDTILPSILDKKNAYDPLRVWVAGCATGEEAYSLAICIQEFLGDKTYSRKIQIFATDVSETAIAKARSGLYRQNELDGLSVHQLSQFFNKVEGYYQVNKGLRDMCVFAHHNLLKDPPFSNLDLVTCRNVLIYLDPILQKRALSTFHYGLNQNGYLMLGKSESVGVSADLFTPAYGNEKIYQTKGAKGRYRNITSTNTERALADFDQEIDSSSKVKDIHQLADNILLEKYTPAGVLVNQNYDVVEFRGKTDQWLVVSPGKPSFNVLKLAREGLAFEIRNLLHLAKTTKTAVKKEQVFFRINEAQQYVDLEVIAIQEAEEDYFLILFQESRQLSTKSADILSDDSSPDDQKSFKSLLDRNAQLEKELSQTREDMRAITEAQEAANEELQSANEELLSGNEELQSLNEELESSKEELQSTNEEITIVNNELLDRNEQLSNARKYNEEIFATIHDPLLILDTELKILRATEGFLRFFKLREEDTEGKFLYDLDDKDWKIPALKTQLMSVLPKQGYLRDFEVENHFSNIGRRLLRFSAKQFAPHNKEKVIILAIHDITDERKVEEGLADTELLLAESQERLYFAMESANIGAWDFNPMSGELVWDQKCKLLHGLQAADPVDYSRYLNQISPSDRDKVALATHRSLIGHADGQFDVEYRLIDSAEGKARWIRSKGKAYFNREKMATRFIGTALDITSAKNLERETRELLIKKDHFIAIASHELNTPITSIKAIIQVLDRSVEKGNTEKLKRLTEKAAVQVDKFTALVDQMLEGTTMQTGQLKLNFSYFSMMDVIKLCTENMDNRDEVAFELLGPEWIKVYADQPRICQVITNLVSNAVKYSPQKALVQIKIREENRKVKVAVTDFGIGVEKRNLPLLFDRFYRVEELNQNYPGLGLGLFLSSEIIKRHHGEIGVESDHGKGSTFWFTIPLEPQKEEQQ